MKRPYFTILATLLIMLTLPACDLVDDQDDPDPHPITAGVLVANQGNFTDGNGSVTLYDTATGQSSEIVENVGSIIQSITLLDNRLYVMANTGNRVNIYSTDDFVQVGQAELPSPRYLTPGRVDEAYVTSQTWDRDPSVRVLDLAQEAVVDSISVTGSPEGLTRAGERIYVATGAFDASTLLEVIDLSTWATLDPIDLECYARLVIADQDDEVFAFCNTDEGEGEVVIVDGADGTIVDRLELGGRVSTSDPGQDAFYAADRNEAYAVLDQERVVRINTIDNEIVEVLGPFDGDPIGAVAYDAVEERLFLGRVPGFDQAGTVTIHERDGAEAGSFSAGVAPTYITFMHEME